MIKKFVFLIISITIAISTIHSQETRKEIISKLFKSVENWFGTNYQFGGITKTGVDCSGFTAQVYDEVFHIKLPRRVTEQMILGKLVEGKLEPGDLIFFNINGDGVSHVGIYVFENKFIHAASGGPQIGVTKSSLKEPYYKNRFAFARRITTLPPYKKSDTNTFVKNIDNSVKKVKVVGKIEFAKILFHGKLFDFTNEFDSIDPIFMQVIAEDDKVQNYIIIIKMKNNKEIKKLNLDLSNGNKYIKRLYLEKGDYEFCLNNNKDEVYKKSIMVK